MTVTEVASKNTSTPAAIAHGSARFAGHKPVLDPPTDQKPTTTTIDGVEYDLTEFLASHPGGADLLMLAMGRDATVMFYSYHRRRHVAEKVLRQLPVVGKQQTGGLKLGAHVNINTSLFNDIQSAANDYFKSTSLQSRGGMLGKTLLLLAATSLVYSAILLLDMRVLCPLLGVLFAMCGLAIQHDANHGAFSKSPMVNRIFGFVDDLIGGSGLMWRHQHVIAHHAHPNDHELDADTFGNYPIMRHNPQMPSRSYMRLQHLYFPLVYMWLGIAYPIDDIRGFISGRYEHVRLHKLRAVDLALFIIGKLIHYTLVLGLPLMTWGVSALWTFYLPMMLPGGWVLASTFAVSHNVESTVYNMPRNACWAETQIRTSANWGVGSSFWLYFSGGLNYQIEHHLFPGVAHIHYPALSEIVEQVCKRHNVPYNSYPRFRDILKSHVAQLRNLGNNLPIQQWTPAAKAK